MSESDDMMYYEHSLLTYERDRTWKTKDGRIMKWEEMETSHLERVLKYLDGGEDEIPILLLVELRLRKAGIKQNEQ